MRTVLKVVGGKNDGREIVVSVPKFIIGRGETAHLRPSSDLVSREHCCVMVSDGKVVIQDLGSRNGTYVNGEKLEGPHIAKTGDSLRIGRLRLEVIIDLAKAGVKRPKVKDVVEAASRTVATKSSEKEKSLDDSISDWLMDDDEMPSINSLRRIGNSETIQVSIGDLDETEIFGDEASEETVQEEKEKSGAKSEEAKEADSDETKSRKKVYGKLPQRVTETAESSTHAADDVLKKFFNRR